jgi:hydroxymethylpyrimidine pyrophosphatase-like HAD family hydrolase
MTQLLENVQAAVIVTLENERVLLDIGRPSLRRKSIVEPLVQPTDLQMDKIFKITLALDDDNAEEMTDILTSRFGDSAAVVRSDPRTIDINAAGTSKGRGIQEFTQLMGISLEHSIAFGNEMNDAAMLETVSIGVAVANANPNLFPFAKKRTLSSADHGVAVWLSEFFELDGIDIPALAVDAQQAAGQKGGV